ncbi:hypothetical protein L204_105749 [Cryptococcus depauperatus]
MLRTNGNSKEHFSMKADASDELQRRRSGLTYLQERFDDLEQGEYKRLVLFEGSHGWYEWSWKKKHYLIATFNFGIIPPQASQIAHEIPAALFEGKPNNHPRDAPKQSFAQETLTLIRSTIPRWSPSLIT